MNEPTDHKYPIRRVEWEFDPARCQAMIPTRGQCPLVQVEGSDYCPCHGGNKAAEAAEKGRMHRYRAAKYQTRLDELTDANSIKSLRDEIAVVRLLVQNHLKFTDDDASHLLLYAPVIQTLVRQVESLSVSCAIVENKLKEFMDTGNAMEMASDILYAVQKVLPDSEISQSVQSEMTEVLAGMYAESHGGVLENYKLQKWVDEVSQFATTERIVSLRNEIGVLRIIVEERLNKCNDRHELLHHAMPISKTIADIERLVKSCQRLEDATGLLLDEQAAAAFTDAIITIVGNHVEDSMVLQSIINEYTSQSNARETSDGSQTA